MYKKSQKFFYYDIMVMNVLLKSVQNPGASRL